jgi:hypothetical protein
LLDSQPFTGPNGPVPGWVAPTFVNPYTSATRPSVAVMAPGMSYFVSPSALLSCTNGTASATAASAIGMFTNKH